MKARFGAYCEVSEHTDITNTQKARTTPAVCLGPTGNIQGTYKFFNLLTGHVIKRWSFTVLPYPNRMIRLVNDLGVRSKQQNYLILKNRKNEDFCCNDDDVDLITDNAIQLPSAPFPDVTAEMSGVQLECEQGVGVVEEPHLPSKKKNLPHLSITQILDYKIRPKPSVRYPPGVRRAILCITSTLTSQMPSLLSISAKMRIKTIRIKLKKPMTLTRWRKGEQKIRQRETHMSPDQVKDQIHRID